MPFYKKAYSKQHGVYYPRAVVQGKPVETENWLGLLNVKFAPDPLIIKLMLDS